MARNGHGPDPIAAYLEGPYHCRKSIYQAHADAGSRIMLSTCNVNLRNQCIPLFITADAAGKLTQSIDVTVKIRVQAEAHRPQEGTNQTPHDLCSGGVGCTFA